jgi:acyl-coenzyme A synthetase/AMP-(fatty) acid ligase
VDSPYLSSHLFEEKITLMKRPYTTTDIIELEDKKFKLLGRVNEIIKISGKRISIVELENIIENGFGIADVLITIKSDNIKSNYPEINFSFELVNVKIIEKNSMGKKVRK